MQTLHEGVNMLASGVFIGGGLIVVIVVVVLLFLIFGRGRGL